MSSDELPSQPRKASWKRWAIGLACVPAIIAVALLLKAPTQEPIRIWSVGSTNENGMKWLVFEGTNATGEEVKCIAGVEMTAPSSFRPGTGPVAVGDEMTVHAAAGTSFTFILAAPPTGVVWHVAWNIVDSRRVETTGERLRQRCAGFLDRHGMPTLARRVEPSYGIRYIRSTEIKE